MKVDVSNISTRYLQRYTLKKEIDNGFQVDSITNEIIYQGTDHEYLVTAMLNAYKEEEGTIEKQCDAENLFSRDVVLKHSEGDYDLPNCITTKQVRLKNSLDCIAERKINIFDYTQTDTKTLEGELGRGTYYKEVFIFRSSLDEVPRLTLNDILALVGGIPDQSAAGFFLEYAQLLIQPIIERQTDPTYGDYEQVVSTKVSISVTYVTIYSPTQITPDWLPALFGGYFYSKLKNDLNNWGAENPNDQTVVGLFNTPLIYQEGYWENGRTGQYIDKTISNTYFINEILQDIFACTGKQLISNFFGINIDGTQPSNKYYEFADSFCQDMKIAQSFDVIREAAIEDSFGRSGIIEVKTLIADLLFMFNLFFVEETETIRLEHKSYFTRKGVDLDGKDYEFAPLKMNAEKIDQELFTYVVNFQNNSHYEAKLVYATPNIYAKPNEKTKATEKLVTDIASSINNEEFNKSEYEDLFFLLSTNGSAVIGLNTQLSMENLIRKLHDLDRPMKSCEINGEKVTFDVFSVGLSGSIKLMTSVITWQNLMPYMSVKTKYGTYLIETTEITEQDLLTLKIKK